MEIKAVTETPGVPEQSNSKKLPGDGEVTADKQKEKQSAYSKAEITKEIGHLNKWLDSKNSHLRFVLHDKLNEYYVQVINDETNEVIKEIPSKKVMDIVASFYEKLGFILDEKI